MANLAKADNAPAENLIVSEAVNAGNGFTVDLYSQVSQTGGNICVSPYSVSAALGMAASGAAGQTAHQMISVLHWPGDLTNLPAAGAALNKAIVQPQGTPTDRDPQITIANALFGQRGLPYQKRFLELMADEYGAPLLDVDFSSHASQACDQINHWAAVKTHNRIKQAVPASAITPQTKLILVDAIYFKAAWREAFSKSGTSDQKFFLLNKDPIHVPTMHEAGTFAYMDSDSFQAAELPYNGDFSMVILLPREVNGLPLLEKSLKMEALDVWLAQLSPRLLQVYLPRFQMESEYELSGDLAKLGMTDAFHSNVADFSGIVSSGKLSIDQVIHKTFISVDEEGTQAAAVTSITMRATAMRAHESPPQPIVFRADHPFLFFLRHRSTGAILFIGRITDPR